MEATIIYVHPSQKSFNNAILQKVTSGLIATGKKVNVIDLYKDNFNPIIDEENLKRHVTGGTTDNNVLKYQQFISDSDEIIFIFPVWWFDMPAMLKGFIDKVMLKDFAYVEGKFGLKGLLTHVKKTTVITTAGAPSWYIKKFSAINKVFINGTLKSVGIKNINWINLGKIISMPHEKREIILEKIEQKFLTIKRKNKKNVLNTISKITKIIILSALICETCYSIFEKNNK